jgi:putative heme transporter
MGSRRADGTQRPRAGLRRVLPALASAGLVVAIFWYLFKQFASVSEVWADISAMTWLELVVLALAAVWNLATYCLVMTAASPGLTLTQALVITESTTAVSNTVPAGAAVGIGLTYPLYASYGFSKSRTTTALLLTGVWNNFVKLGMPVVALAIVAVQGNADPGRISAAALGVAGLLGAIGVLGLVLRSDEQARQVGLRSQALVNRALSPLHRPAATGWEIATVRFRSRTVDILRANWLRLTASTLVSHVSLYLVLLTALRAVGVAQADVGWAKVLVIFAFARLVTAIPITPGGVGIVELALVSGLVAYGGDRSAVVAGVLVYRLLTYALPIPVGLVTYLWWRRGSRARALEQL